MTVHYRCQVCGAEVEVEGEDAMRYKKAKRDPPMHCDQRMIAW
jgi:DNA-directed RNA polymerase subunit RPC12/RpoP